MDLPSWNEWTTEVLPEREGVAKQVHIFNKDTVRAVYTAFAARRPLLVRGEPGMGKSQLARAVAQKLQRPFVPFVVDSGTESHDLMWSYDAVRRLADAQLLSTVRHSLPSVGKDGNDCDTEWKLLRQRLDAELAVSKYVSPGPLWWAFSWKGAERQSELSGTRVRVPDQGAAIENGCVLLIDEIDKAETDVPNGLLEALGDGQFVPFGSSQPVSITGKAPLVVITSNEERTLPNAFVRRCVVLSLELPDTTTEELTAHLVDRGVAHFPELADAKGREVLLEAAKQLDADRQAAKRNHTKPYPGQAEYLDLVRALVELGSTNAERCQLVADLKKFVFQKFPKAAT